MWLVVPNMAIASYAITASPILTITGCKLADDAESVTKPGRIEVTVYQVQVFIQTGIDQSHCMFACRRLIGYLSRALLQLI